MNSEYSQGKTLLMQPKKQHSTPLQPAEIRTVQRTNKAYLGYSNSAQWENNSITNVQNTPANNLNHAQGSC